MLYSYIRLYTTTYTRGRAVTKKTGPDDVSGVVWAICKYFYFYFVFFFYY